jgi:toxin FitB
VYLLDTDALSAVYRADRPIVDWLRMARGQELYVSVLTLGEIRRGTTKIRNKRPRVALNLEQWLANTIAQFSDNILAVDLDVARVWGELSVMRPLPAIDSLIAATALHRGLAVVTRNDADYVGVGVAVVNPWRTTTP